MKRKHPNALLLKIFCIALTFIIVGDLSIAKAHEGNQCNSNNPDNCPIPTQICNNGEHEGNPHCITPTVTPTISLSPTPTDPIASPSALPAEEETPPPAGHGDGLSDGRSDGRSDGLCSKPPCVPLGAPATGRAEH